MRGLHRKYRSSPGLKRENGTENFNHPIKFLTLVISCGASISASLDTESASQKTKYKLDDG